MFKKNYKLLAMFLTIMLLVAGLSGCGQSSNEAATAEVKDSLVVATTYDAKSLDPHATNDVASSNVMQQIYENLVTLDENNQVIPQLAEKFEKLDDKTYKFYLRKGVKFHNGEELKASDVKFTFERALAKGGSIKHIVGDIDPNGFEIVDDYTIIIRTKVPSTAFLPSLIHVGGGSILNEKAVKEAGDDYGMNPVGTGPFKFVSWAKGDKIVLKRNEDYYGEKPKFSELVIRAIPEATNRTIELESGGVDIAYSITPNDVSRVEENPDLKLLRKIDNSTTYLGFNCEKAPFDDERVRQAISYALDTESIVKSVFRGVGGVAIGPVAPNVNYYNANLGKPDYDVEKAKKLLAEAGYKDGFKTVLWTNDKKERIDMATIIQNQLKQIGIEVEIQVLEWSAYLEGLKQKQQDMFIVGWTCQTPDPDMALYGPFHSSMKGNNNFTFFGDEKVDELIEKGRLLEDSKERQEVYYEIQKLIREKSPWVFLNNGEQVVGVRKNVKGFTPSPFGYHKLYNVYFEDQQ
ncbi:glutathione ABC transporter substrate-binding protein [Crassaminicella thermophila]|uniref:Glutathione ABC transporter substrate-binding protein n=1 Tax=Crassaminicella thermophila TaxID=2599308 RepID=A0A5C0SJ22_CRATE|nr:ABC transporter substrate-binding protein [Crassaminicella thermophila]QEK12949.1 glutathione ABC transporter substrate-binding protein [Crassaminicella thermophila]